MIKSFFIIMLFFCFSSSAQEKGLSIADKIISISGKKLEINADGFPKQIQSFYDWEFNKFGFKPTNLLYEPMHFHLYNTPKTQDKLVVNTFNLLTESKDSIVWEASSSSASISQHVKAKIDENGLINYNITLKALKDISFSNINFHIPFEKNSAKYLLGLGNKGYLRPDTVKWDWKSANVSNPEVLIGNDSIALYLSLDQHKNPENLHIKNGWRNDDIGLIQINIKGSSMLADFSTGSVILKGGEELTFDFNLFITPVNRKDGRRSLEKRFNAYKRLVADGKKSMR